MRLLLLEAEGVAQQHGHLEVQLARGVARPATRLDGVPLFDGRAARDELAQWQAHFSHRVIRANLVLVEYREHDFLRRTVIAPVEVELERAVPRRVESLLDHLRFGQLGVAPENFHVRVRGLGLAEPEESGAVLRD